MADIAETRVTDFPASFRGRLIHPGDPDYDRLFAICNKANRGQFAAYQKMTERPLPVVVLSRR